jgi:hypothetical protein
MCRIRTYIDQFEKADVEKIEHIFDLLEDLKTRNDDLKFYCVELKCSLIGGSVLGGLLITFSILEMYLLHNYVIRILGEDSSKYNKAIYLLERKNTHLKNVVAESKNMDLIDDSSGNRIIELYNDYRIPLMHGLRTKGIYDQGGFSDFIKEIDSLDVDINSPVSWQEMESIIEEDGLNVIQEIFEIITK